MTDPNLTAITVILDRSGSMEAIERDVIGGFNAFVDEQKKSAGTATLTMVRFNSKVTTDYVDKPIADVPKLMVLQPGGWTALYDAVGNTIDELGSRLSGLSEDKRPGRVIVVIITDGEENSSKEYSQRRVADLIKHQTEKYNWQFTYLGANQDAVLAAKKMGIAAGNAADFSMGKSHTAFMCASSAVKSYRSAAVGSCLRSYSAQERSELVADAAAFGKQFTLDPDPAVHALGHTDLSKLKPVGIPDDVKTIADAIDHFKTIGDLKMAADLQILVDQGALNMGDSTAGRAFISQGQAIGNLQAVAKVQLQP